MSMTYAVTFNQPMIEEFLLNEHTIDTGIPVHPFSVIRSTFPQFERTIGLTDGQGTLFFTGTYEMTAYGVNNNHNHMIRALESCGAQIDFIW